jgi:hypothetical protein
MKTRCLISRTIGSYLLRVANLNAKAMFLNIPKQNKPLFFASKSKIDISEEYTEDDKAQMMAFIEKN